MLKVSYPTDYLKKEGINSKVVQPSEEAVLYKTAIWQQLRRLKRSDGDSGTSQDPTWFDTPPDGSCLFWSVTLAYLVPVKGDENGFKQRYEVLFGDEEAGHVEHIRNLIQNYNPRSNAESNDKLKDNIFKRLVTNVFRNRVVNYIENHRGNFESFIDQDFSEYLNKMRGINAWGGEPEIKAMSEMLGANITVFPLGDGSSHDNGDVLIKLLYIRQRNHYNFGLEQNIIDTNQQPSTKPELIDLLLTEPINQDNKGNTVHPRDKENPIGFAEKFSLFLKDNPKIGSTTKKEFFVHSILGLVSTCSNSKLMKELNIENIYVKHTVRAKRKKGGQREVTSDVVKLCFVFEKNGKKQVALRVFTDGEVSNQFFDNDELKEIAEKVTDIDGIDEYSFRIIYYGLDIPFGLDQQEKSRTKDDLTKDGGVSRGEFKEVIKVLPEDLEVRFDRPFSEEQEEDFWRDTLENFRVIHGRIREKFSLSDSEAALHGFYYGALLFFKYRYGLDCYAERTAGKGRADLICVLRGNSLIIIEFKGKDYTVDDAIRQVFENGYFYNINVRTVAKRVVIAGVNVNGVKTEVHDLGESVGLLNQVLETSDQSYGNELEEEVKNLYYSIRSSDKHYLGNLVSGQALATLLSYKGIFRYTSNIGKEVITFAFRQEEGNLAVILNIIEHTGREPRSHPLQKTRSRDRQDNVFDSDRVPLIGNDETAIKIDITINSEAKSFKSSNIREMSYLQDIRIGKISSSEKKEKKKDEDKCKKDEKKDKDKGKYRGDFQEIRYVDVDNLIENLRRLGDADDTKVVKALSPLAEALFSLPKERIKKEAEFQEVLLGLFKKGGIRAQAESNVSSQGIIDLLLGFVGTDNRENKDPFVIELKVADGETDAEIKLESGKEQMGKYQDLGSFTGRREAKHLVIVLNKAARSKEDLFLASMKTIQVYQNSSPGAQNQGSTSKSPCPSDDGRKKRSTDCLFSWNDIDKFNNAEGADRRDMNKIEIDYARFLPYVLNNTDIKKSVQLVQFAEEIFEKNLLHSDDQYDEQDSATESEDGETNSVSGIREQSPGVAVLFEIIMVGGSFYLFKTILDDESRKNDYLNARNDNGKTLLHLAAQYGRLEIAKCLAEQGADINAKDMGGSTPFEVALEHNKTEVIKFLAIAKDRNDNTALHYAAEEGKFTLVKILLDNQAGINAKNKDGETPLLLAVEKGYLNIVKLLVNSGARIQDKDKYGMTLFEAALEYDRTEVANFLATAKDRRNMTALHYAVSDNNSDLVMLLINKGANINSKDNNNKTPSDIAIELGYTDMVISLALRQMNEITIFFTSHDTTVQGNDGNSSGKDLETQSSSSESGYLSSSVRKRRSADLLSLWDDILDNLKYANSEEENEIRSEYRSLISYIQGNKDKKEISWLFERAQELQDLKECLEDEDEDEDNDEENRPKNKGSKPGSNTQLPYFTKLLLFGIIAAITAVSFLTLFKKLFDSLSGSNICIDTKDKDGKTFLHFAAQYGKIGIAKYLIEKCADINAKDNDDNTALHYAAEGGNLDLVRFLIENGADISARNKDDMTSFEIALEYNQTEVAEFLATAKDKNDNTALHYAAKEGKFDLIVLLLNNKAGINAKNKDGDTPLLLAAKKGYLNIVQLLVNNGADIIAKDKNDKIPFEIALEYNQIEVAEFLATAKDKNNNTALHYAAEEGNLDLVGFLIEKGADINARGKGDMIPFEIALKYNQTVVAEFLATAKDKDDNTALHYAAEEDRQYLTTKLLYKGADLEAKNKDGMTPLLLAAKRDSTSVVISFLVSRVFLPNIGVRDKFGRTALQIALEYNQTNMVDILQAMQENYNDKLSNSIAQCDLSQAISFLDRGADGTTGEKGKVLLYKVVVHYCCLSVAKLFIGRGANIHAKYSNGRTLLHEVCDDSMAGLLIGEHADVNAKDDFGATPLHHAAELCNLDIVKSLIGEDADVNDRDNFGATPLHYAVETGALSLVQFLVDRGADIKAKDNNGQTPLYHAIQWLSSDVVQFLVGRGADVNDRDDLNKTPLHHAVRAGALSLVQFLVDRGANISATDVTGKTPLDLAYPGSEVERFLREKRGERSIQRRRRHHHGDHPRHHSGEQKYLQREERSIHLESKGASHSIENDNSAIESNRATSAASKPSSWINIFANTIVDAVKGVSKFIFSPFKPTMDMEHSQPSKAIIAQGIDTNGTLLLLDVFIRKVTGQKYISTVGQPTPLLEAEARGYALNITTEFERVLKDTAKRSGVSVNKSSFDSLEVYQAIEGKMISGELSKIPTILYLAAKEAYPKSEKFLGILEGNIKKMLNEQQIVNNRNSSNQTQSITSTNNKMPLSLLNNTAIEPANSKKGITSAN